MTRSFLLTITFLVATVAISFAQFQFVHPPQISAEDFQPPPATEGVVWDGPYISQFADAACWYAEPEAPTVAVGGSDEWQSVVGFIPLPNIPDIADYRQQNLQNFSGGGGETKLTPEDLPA